MVSGVDDWTHTPAGVKRSRESGMATTTVSHSRPLAWWTVWTSTAPGSAVGVETVSSSVRWARTPATVAGSPADSCSAAKSAAACRIPVTEPVRAAGPVDAATRPRRSRASTTAATSSATGSSDRALRSAVTGASTGSSVQSCSCSRQASLSGNAVSVSNQSAWAEWSGIRVIISTSAWVSALSSSRASAAVTRRPSRVVDSGTPPPAQGIPAARSAVRISAAWELVRTRIARLPESASRSASAPMPSLIRSNHTLFDARPSVCGQVTVSPAARAPSAA